ncbi:D-alanyl-D-alanine carboxypeptidase [Clostridium sp. SYSU_GA19001]|uniref:D-alanyl-D-alanine carboxypeptidase family protein n=1 Tax=Clostridium caldaquaticum TaxID=2940653 RepID=UPI00207725D1|nr:D-alanyl-D-alanine carboxypeptidase family protein [Clostridium caldaquaticum]MCM8711489.1 D-alanyl-D-alanine carboxypeptidase [Clostridium caldaquaticum]
MKRASLSFLLASILIFTGIGNVRAAGSEMPKIEGKAGITIDIDTGEIIYANNIDEKYYPASTTKLLTGLVFAENKSKSDEIKYTESAKNQPPYSIDKTLHKMQIGESMSAEDTLDALLIFSANDSAYMIADSVSGDSARFADLLNERIKKLGLKNTHFVTANGLHNPEHYTTPYDLSVIGREAFKNDWVRETMAKKESEINTSTGAKMFIKNWNKLLGIDGCIGGKTGYTDQAGRVLVAFFERNGRKMAGVVMKSVYDSEDTAVFEDMKKIIDWSYNAQPVTLHKSGDTVKIETINYKPFKFFGPEKKVEVPIILREDVKYYDNSVNKAEVKENYNIENLSVWNLNSEKAIGTFELKEREALKNYKLYTTISTKDIIKQNTLLYLGVSLAVVMAIILVLLLILKIKSSRRKSRNYYY